MKNIYTIFRLCMLLCLVQTATAQVPQLSSFPAASAVIFLDFDGHVVEGTVWNGSGPIVCNGANLNSAQIAEVYNRVAEDYRPFNINVTTDSTVYARAPLNRRMRVVLTTSSSWYGSAGGVSFNNSFTWGDNTPCFVFTALLNYNAKYISESASHEVGHTLGLNHQSSYDAVCNKTAEYNAGVGSGEIGWAPIMGVGYYRNQTLWHYGSNPFGCSYMQDDLGIITGRTNGFGYRADDHSNTVDAATVARFTNNQFSVAGVVERPEDIDMITFTLPAKNRVQVDALPFSIASGDVGANVDLQVELMDNNQTVVGVYNPATLLSASFDTLLNAGTYYLRVKGTGNTFAPNFASLGSYTVSANITATILPLHKLELAATADANRQRLNWEIVADEKVVSQTLEVSTDGAHFQPFTTVAASARSYAVQSSQTGLLYYRLSVTFDDGRQYYSNVAALRSGGAGKPQLMGNVVASTLTVNSPATFAYALLDMNGRVVAKGQLTQGLNTLSTGFLPHGMYVVQFTSNQEQYTEKFMKQ